MYVEVKYRSKLLCSCLPGTRRGMGGFALQALKLWPNWWGSNIMLNEALRKEFYATCYIFSEGNSRPICGKQQVKPTVAWTIGELPNLPYIILSNLHIPNKFN